MNSTKRKKLEAKGWKFGDVQGIARTILSHATDTCRIGIERSFIIGHSCESAPHPGGAHWQVGITNLFSPARPL